MKFGEASIFVTQILKSLDFDPKISKKKRENSVPIEPKIVNFFKILETQFELFKV